MSDLPRLTDSDLLFLVSRGELDALGVIYDRHVDAAWTAALKLSNDVTTAERAVSEAFLRLWRTPEPAEQVSLSARLLSTVWREASGAPV